VFSKFSLSIINHGMLIFFGAKINQFNQILKKKKKKLKRQIQSYLSIMLFHYANITTTVPITACFTHALPLPKKAGADQCNNFRTLSLISHASKL